MVKTCNAPVIEERQYRVDPFLWLIPLILSLIGVVMIFSLTSPESISNRGLHSSLGIKQLQWLVIGLAAMLVMYLIPFILWQRISGFLWIIAVGITAITLLHGVGLEAGGAKRWINIGGVRLQPLEILSLVYVLHLSKILSVTNNQSVKVFLKLSVIATISIVPVILQPDLGGTILLFLLGMAMFVEAYGWLIPLITGFIMLPGLFILIFKESYRVRRYLAFIDPWKDPLDKGFQIIQGLIAFANGGILGVGIGKGLQKLNYLPAAHTDFIFAALGEEFGLAGTGFIVMLFATWSYRIFCIYRKSDSSYIKILLWGLCVSILLPFFINVAGVTKLLPLTGMPLPFVSYGGSSLVSSWMAIGLILRCSKDVASGDDM